MTVSPPSLSTDDFLATGAEAAPAFGLDASEISLLSHSENVVLRVKTTDGEQFAMRVHRPGYNSLAEMESEVWFADSLRRFGVPVPEARPVNDGSGHYLTADVGGIAHHIGVIAWVAGEPLGGPLNPGGPETAAHYHRIGELAAQIRAHNATWEAPEGFTRRRWDADGLVGEAPVWDRFWEVDLLTDSQRALFTDARSHLVDLLGSLPTTGDSFGLIHADLHLGNVMADGDALTIIDFDDAGYGWFAHELAVALHPMLGEDTFDDALASLLAGYQSVHPISDGEVKLIDSFLAMRSLMIVGWHAARPEVPYYEQWDELLADIESHITEYMAAI